MTAKMEEIKKINKLVVNFDICSSSHIIEDLLKTDNIKIWRDLLIGMEEHLTKKSSDYDAEIYKFTGDGWIILFDQPYSGTNIFKFLRDIDKELENIYNDKVFVSLDIPPKIYGLTVGIDEGPLISLKMNNVIEYIGRPINIACRLQSVINEIDIKGGFRIFMSHRLYHTLKDELAEYYPKATERPLRNISGGANFMCYRLAISDMPFRIISVIYGTPKNKIDVTYQYTKQIINNSLDILVTNEIAENDPHKGVRKTLSIKYAFQGKIYIKEVNEGARLQLPENVKV